MPLLLGDEVAPDVDVGAQPLVRPAEQDVVGEDVVVAQRGDDGDVAEDGRELGGDVGVGVDDLAGGAGDALVAIVPRRVAGPDDEVDVLADVGRDPREGVVDQGEGAVAVGLGRAVVAGGAVAGGAVAGWGGGARFVVGIWVQVWRGLVGVVRPFDLSSTGGG